MAAKRPRESSGGGPHRVILNVGGTTFHTTKQSVERSTYLAGLIDTSAWDADADHVAELFVDRDPEVFALLLRLMRTVPLVAGLLPHDKERFAALLAEADFFGFDAMLEHVKGKSFYNVRSFEAEDRTQVGSIYDSDIRAAHTAATAEERREAILAARVKARDKRVALQTTFSLKDEAYGSRRFDVLHGSIGDALASGLLPNAYLSPPKQAVRILQLLPVEATTWFLIGDAQDDYATVVQGARSGPGGGDDKMKPMKEIVERPFIVRRVACHALLENEQGKQWMEPMLYVGADDLQEWMNHQPFDGDIVSRDNTMNDPACTVQTGGLHLRTMLASKYMELAKQMHLAHNYNGAPELFDQLSGDWWTHLLVAELPPAEIPCTRTDING